MYYQGYPTEDNTSTLIQMTPMQPSTNEHGENGGVVSQPQEPPAKPTGRSKAAKKTYVMNMADVRSVDAIKLCQDVGLLANDMKCGECGAQMNLKSRRNNKGSDFDATWLCCLKHQTSRRHVKMSIKSGTVFHNSKVPIQKILELMYLWVHGCAEKFISHETRIGRSTMLDWIHVCQNVCVVTLEKNSVSLGGEGKVIEIHESMFGKKSCLGKAVQDRWVFGGIQINPNQCFLVTLEDETGETLAKTMAKYILPYTTVAVVCFKAFKCMEERDFEYLTQTHGLKFKDKKRGNILNSVEQLWDLAKRKASEGQWHVSKNFLAQYLYRKSLHPDVDPFLQFLWHAASVHPPGLESV